jgi:hypothetical protein
MDLAAPRDEVLTQKDQANAAFLLHGYGIVHHYLTIQSMAGKPFGWLVLDCISTKSAACKNDSSYLL